MVRHLVFAPRDLVSIRDVRVTSLPRTLRDICVLESKLEALIALDLALHLRRISKLALSAYVGGAAGLPGARRLRRLLELAEPAESQMETRLRWLLFEAGLPRPEVQTDLRDEQGNFLGWADLYYPAAHLVIEYDGGNHRERLVSDDRRQNLLINAGYRILRFTAADIYGRPEVVVAQVRGSL